MKKILSIFLLQLLVLGAVFGVPVNSKLGYRELLWGSTVQDAQKAGYKLTLLGKDYSEKLYSVPVDIYKVSSKEINVKALQFHYYMGNLFLVSETLNTQELSPQRLSARYGNYNQQEIFLVGKQYTDAKFDKEGSVTSLSINISTNSAGNVTATMYDWNIYRIISYAGQKLVNRGQEISKNVQKTIVDELESMAMQLIQEKSGVNKPVFAFYPLTTDYKNALTENYVTDALTEAMFNSGKIKIIERNYLESVLKEQKFQSSGLVNEQTAKSIGMLVGADFICYGTLKDFGEKFTVNARVVNVETAELCAIARAMITKDDYLKKRSTSAEGTPVSSIETKTAKTDIASAAKETPPMPPKTTTKKTTTVANNAWKVTKYRNDFDSYTNYLFKVYSTDHRFIFILYKKCDVPANSRVIAGVHWSSGFSWESEGTYDIKSKEGTISRYYGDHWECDADDSGKDKFSFVWNQKEGSRTLTERFKNNETVSLRRDNLVRKFQTAGLVDKMAEYGITWAEIDAAIANEEF